jgi:membrane protease subunit HflK
MSLNDPNWGRNAGQKSDSDQGSRRPKNNDGPPDLDELWRDFNRRLSSLFGGRGGDPGNSGGNRPGTPFGNPFGSNLNAGIGLGVLLALMLLLWLGSGFYIVQEGQAAVVMRFGEFRELNNRAGFTWRFPSPIETHELVNVQQLRQLEVGYRSNVKNKVLKESLILTGDQSIVDMQYAVQYRIGDPQAWLFNNNPGPQPEEIIRQSAETAMRETVGRRQIDQVLYEEKEQVAKIAQKLMQDVLDRYKAGVSVVDVTVQQVQPPEQVQAAFEDANKAAQDRERLINEGRAYANDVIPKARGTAARLLQEADGHKQRVIAMATGDASRFESVLKEYAKAPQVTRDRLYLDTMQQVFQNTSKVYVDSKNANNLLYLPLDKLIQQVGAGSTAALSAAGGGNAPAATNSVAQAPAGSSPPMEPDPRPRTDPRENLRNRERP